MGISAGTETDLQGIEGECSRQSVEGRTKYPSLHQDPAPPNCLQPPGLDTSHQTTSKTEPQPHPSVDRLPKVVLSSQTPKTHQPMGPCSSKRKDSAPPTREQTPVPPTKKPTQALEQPHPPGGRQQKQEDLQHCSLWKGDYKHNKLDMLQMKEQGKNP